MTKKKAGRLGWLLFLQFGTLVKMEWKNKTLEIWGYIPTTSDHPIAHDRPTARPVRVGPWNDTLNSLTARGPRKGRSSVVRRRRKFCRPRSDDCRLPFLVPEEV